jgi:hypothetical protein
VEFKHIDCELILEVFKLKEKKKKNKNKKNEGNTGTKATASMETPSSNPPPAHTGDTAAQEVAAPTATTNPPNSGFCSSRSQHHGTRRGCSFSSSSYNLGKGRRFQSETQNSRICPRSRC